jgi:hypothetical protein
MGTLRALGDTGRDIKTYACDKFCELSPRQQGYVRIGILLGSCLLLGSVCGCITTPDNHIASVNDSFESPIDYIHGSAEDYLATHGGGNISDYTLVPLEAEHKADFFNEALRINATGISSYHEENSHLVTYLVEGDAIVPKTSL